ncbi:MAG: tetratricopeptide repeat protein [Candidatus Sulfotelmatobacter sp.]
MRDRRRRPLNVTPPTPEQRSWQLRSWMLIAIAAAALCALVLIAYAKSLSNSFVWDDNQQIVMNPDLRPDAPWSHLFSSDVWGYKHPNQPGHTNYYRPFQMIAYRLTAEWFGLQSQSLHTLSIVFALAAVLAAFTVYLKLTRRLAVAFSAAALFAVHPVHSEAVDWISALPELGCATFVLISFALFLSSYDPGSGLSPTRRFLPRHWILLCLSLLAFAAALLWKETAMVFPAIIAAYAVCLRAGNFKERLLSSAKLSVPFCCVLAAYLVLRFRMLGSLTTRQRIWGLTSFQVGLNVFHLLAQYWWKLIAPLPLNAYYVFSPVHSIADPRAIVGILFVALACVAIGYAFGRAPLIAFAGLWVFITLLPVMNIYALGRNAFAERYLYLPSVGFCLLVAAVAASAVKRLPQNFRKPLSVLLLVAVVVWFSAETFARNPDWHDDATLFRKTLGASPDAPFVHFMVAATEGDNPAESESAEVHYLRAIALARDENPPDSLDLARSYEGLASLYSDRGDYARALQVLREWRDAVPSDPELDAEEGLVLLKSGRWQEAGPILNRAYAAHPQDENVLNALGLLSWEHERNLVEAERFFTRALAIHTAKDDFQASLHNNLGGVYGDLQQFPLALEQFESAIAISPADAEYHTNMAVALAELNRFEEAAAEVKIALRIAPNYPPARAVLERLQRR